MERALFLALEQRSIHVSRNTYTFNVVSVKSDETY